MSEIQSLPGMEGLPDPLDAAQLRAEEARAVFEARWGNTPWMDDYFRLLAEGWDCRQAAYIIWACQPKGQRDPQTQQEFAVSIGLTSDRTIRKWRDGNPAIDERIHELTASALMQARAEVFGALIAAATNPSPRACTDRKLFFEMTGDYSRDQVIRIGTALPDDLAELSAEELRALAQTPGALAQTPGAAAAGLDGE